MAGKVGFWIFYSKLLSEQIFANRLRNGFCLDRNKLPEAGTQVLSLLLKGKQSGTLSFPKSIICQRINRCFGDSGVIKLKWQMIFSWASCSTDVILRQVLLGSKAQLANQLGSCPVCQQARLPSSALLLPSVLSVHPRRQSWSPVSQPEVPLLFAHTGQQGEEGGCSDLIKD